MSGRKLKIACFAVTVLKENFHHAEIRAGNGADNAVAYLMTGRKIAIYRIEAHAIVTAVSSSPHLARLAPLLRQPRKSRKHVGYWFEQYVLLSEPGAWRWNTSTKPDKALSQLLTR